MTLRRTWKQIHVRFGQSVFRNGWARCVIEREINSWTRMEVARALGGQHYVPNFMSGAPESKHLKSFSLLPARLS
jgi:hypothetical protein